MNGLRKNERCPIHRRLDCCGREGKEMPRRNPIRGPVTKMPDGNGGEIVVCSPSELRRRKLILIERQKGICHLCSKPMLDVRDTDVDHIVPRPAGCKKDSSWGNIQAVHHSCNLEKGSKRENSLSRQ